MWEGGNEREKEGGREREEPRTEAHWWWERAGKKRKPPRRLEKKQPTQKEESWGSVVSWKQEKKLIKRKMIINFCWKDDHWPIRFGDMEVIGPLGRIVWMGRWLWKPEGRQCERRGGEGLGRARSTLEGAFGCKGEQRKGSVSDRESMDKWRLVLLWYDGESESEVAQSCPTLCDPMDCSLPHSSVHGIFQARVLQWVAISFSNDVQSWLLINACYW